MLSPLLGYTSAESAPLDTYVALLFDDPEIGAVLVQLRDISELKRLEAVQQETEQRELQALTEAQLAQQRLRSLLAQAPALIHIVRGPVHVFEFFHPLGKELVGERDLTGMKVREVLPEYEGQGYFELLDHVYQTGDPSSFTEIPSLLKAAAKISPQKARV